ncbi:MAG: methionine adenosyltransferase [Varibaculum sp.]|nr:methionine adenosyltransferase [Varibaculum sp.]
MREYLFTSESVTSGHPDKVCDAISDAILDDALRQDPDSRVAAEVMAASGIIHIAGEMTTTADWVDVKKIARQVLVDIGYDSPESGMDGRSVGVDQAIDPQSPDIAAGVNTSWEKRAGMSELDKFDLQGAGDQGMMFGYAVDETPDLMPMPIWLAHRFARRLEAVRRHHTSFGLLPDGKTQVTVRYRDGRPVAVDTVVVSAQHRASVPLDEVREFVREQVISPLLAELDLQTDDVAVLVNPAGSFIYGGPIADTGLTGRKIIVDTYGGRAPHGGGAFSGKDPSKVDRSASYAARWAAKNVVAAGLASECLIQVAYAIGSARPVGLMVDTFGTGDDDRVLDSVRRVFDFRPAAIIEQLDLRRPIYSATSAYGHFGRPEFTWEQLNMVDRLRA